MEDRNIDSIVALIGKTENELSKVIVDACCKVHNVMGPGLLESVYEEILAHELKKQGLNITRQQGIEVIYEDVKLDIGFRSDIIVENKVILEIKAVEELNKLHQKQVLTYLRLTKMKLGILVNFNEELIRNGIKRIVNGL